jgi:hypothetical protein
MAGRHKKIQLDPDLFPAWMRTADEFSCLYGVAEDAYTAKYWADQFHASEYKSSAEPYAAAMKSLAQMNNIRLLDGMRSRAGMRAARKFWEAKTAARRHS